MSIIDGLNKHPYYGHVQIAIIAVVASTVTVIGITLILHAPWVASLEKTVSLPLGFAAVGLGGGISLFAYQILGTKQEKTPPLLSSPSEVTNYPLLETNESPTYFIGIPWNNNNCALGAALIYMAANPAALRALTAKRNRNMCPHTYELLRLYLQAERDNNTTGLLKYVENHLEKDIWEKELAIGGSKCYEAADLLAGIFNNNESGITGILPTITIQEYNLQGTLIKTETVKRKPGDWIADSSATLKEMGQSICRPKQTDIEDVNGQKTGYQVKTVSYQLPKILNIRHACLKKSYPPLFSGTEAYLLLEGKRYDVTVFCQHIGEASVTKGHWKTFRCVRGTWYCYDGATVTKKGTFLEDKDIIGAIPLTVMEHSTT